MAAARLLLLLAPKEALEEDEELRGVVWVTLTPDGERLAPTGEGGIPDKGEVEPLRSIKGAVSDEDI